MNNYVCIIQNTSISAFGFQVDSALNNDFHNSPFLYQMAKAKNTLALGVRVNAIVMICQSFSSSQICFLYQNLEAVIYEKLSEQTLQLCYHNSSFLFSSFHL